MSAGRSYRRRIRRWRVMFVLPGTPDAASPALKNGVAIRAVASRTGRCPSCNAEMVVEVDPTPETVGHARMAHEDGCPALLGGD